ncbi:MAG: hypothetical protein ACD_46C00575G0006 [uncultured bacterium]|nr:MAG: hypothetical protein ACD_46C00575G0006 [uncultured bacterium]
MQFLKIIILFFISFAVYATDITHLVVFGDSMSDRGNTIYGGFNRYSNGKVWPEYLAEYICRDCLQDYAWGGARSDAGNYNGFNWSGLSWQIDQFKLTSDPNKTLFIIWIGANDLINGNGSRTKATKNIAVAINKLTAKGAKNIVVLTLLDFTKAPVYNNPTLPDYAKFSKIKDKVQYEIAEFNHALLSEVIPKKSANYSVKIIQADDFFDYLFMKKIYKNTRDPWLGTYYFPDKNGYLWWDAWHPMTSVHEKMANFLMQELKENNYYFVNRP